MTEKGHQEKGDRFEEKRNEQLKREKIGGCSVHSLYVVPHSFLQSLKVVWIVWLGKAGASRISNMILRGHAGGRRWTKVDQSGWKWMHITYESSVR